MWLGEKTVGRPAGIHLPRRAVLLALVLATKGTPMLLSRPPPARPDATTAKPSVVLWGFCQEGNALHLWAIARFFLFTAALRHVREQLPPGDYVIERDDLSTPLRLNADRSYLINPPAFGDLFRDLPESVPVLDGKENDVALHRAATRQRFATE